ncbi:MAG: DNA polymerase III subunit chi [Limnohabitans sp.]
MTRIEFHFNVRDTLTHACRLARKARAQGQSMVVTGETSLLQAFDQALWTFSAVDFLPHRWADQTGNPAAITLAPDMAVIEPDDPLLINLGATVPRGFEAWPRLIEIVDQDPQSRRLARDRWRHYTERGYTLERHDLSGEAQ